MNAGLGTLTQLKAHLLNEQIRAKSNFDTAIKKIGLGVAARFEGFCNRKFARVEDHVEIIPADRMKHVVERYPLESISGIAVKQVEADDWTALSVSDLIVNRLDRAGLVYFYGQQGWQRGVLRLTYTGGFWFDTEDDEGAELPDGATALPDDLHLAWLLQCEAVWQLRDKLGIAVGEKAETKKTLTLGNLVLVPEVEATLRTYQRYS